MEAAHAALDLAADDSRPQGELVAELGPFLARRGVKTDEVLSYLRDDSDDQSPREARAAHLVKLAGQET